MYISQCLRGLRPLILAGFDCCDAGYIKCSQSILMPSIMSTSPPMGSTGNRSLFPTILPMKQPMRASTNEASPIASSGNPSCCKLSIPMQVNEMPTARASMLTAMDRVSTVPMRVGSKWCPSSPLNPSRIIFTPRKVSMAKAIQWS